MRPKRFVEPIHSDVCWKITASVLSLETDHGSQNETAPLFQLCLQFTVGQVMFVQVTCTNITCPSVNWRHIRSEMRKAFPCDPLGVEVLTHIRFENRIREKSRLGSTIRVNGLDER